MLPLARPVHPASVPLVSLLGLVLLASCRRHEPPPELVTLPSFSLTEAHGGSFGTSQMKGRVWIADFFFTQCPTYCPLLTEKMKGLRERLKDVHEGLGMLSISVDPAHDTPEVLRRYAAEHGIDADATGLPPWRMLTGETDAIVQVVVGAFRLPISAPRPLPKERGEPGGYEILHARHLVLVDERGIVRGFYRTDPEDMERLERDARRLAEDLED